MASSAGIKWQNMTDDAMEMTSKTQSSVGTPTKTGLNRLTKDKNKK